MSCRLTALSVFFLLFLRVQSIDSTHARSFPLPQLDFPEIDGSAVDICRILTVPLPDTTTMVTTTTTTTTTTKPVTRKQVVATTKKTAVQSLPRKPDNKNPGAPIRPQPAPAGPITNSHSDHIHRLLHLLLANGRQHAAGSLISQPIGRLPHRRHSTSDSDELVKRQKKTVERRKVQRWKIGSLSSEDSSDES